MESLSNLSPILCELYQNEMDFNMGPVEVHAYSVKDLKAPQQKCIWQKKKKKPLQGMICGYSLITGDFPVLSNFLYLSVKANCKGNFNIIQQLLNVHPA